jgi:hypothetical protein
MSDSHPSVRPTEYTLLGTDDAMVWAEEFCRIFNGFTISTADKDGLNVGPGTMVGWFANAMQTALNLQEEEEEEPPSLEEHFREGFDEGRTDDSTPV